MDGLAPAYARARKLSAIVELQLDAPSSEESLHALTANLNALQSEVAALERSVEQNNAGDLWRRRCAQLQADSQQLRKTVERLLRQKHDRSRAVQERAELLGEGAGSHAVAVDALLRERASLASSARMIDEYTGLAGNVLTSLKAQRGVLKGAHKKVLDVAGALGLSNSLMRIIGRRTVADKILVYGGFAVLLALVGLVWWLR